MILTGSIETTVKGKNGRATDKSCNGNACHIDQATPREVGNGVIPACCLPVSSLGALTLIFTAIHFFLEAPCLFLHLFIPCCLPLFHPDPSEGKFSNIFPKLYDVSSFFVCLFVGLFFMRGIKPR